MKRNCKAKGKEKKRHERKESKAMERKEKRRK